MSIWSSKNRSVEWSDSGELRFRAFLGLSLVFLLATPVALSAVELFSIRTYALVSFVWILITSEVLAPNESGTEWWRRLRWFKIFGWFVLIYIVLERFAAVLL